MIYRILKILVLFLIFAAVGAGSAYLTLTMIVKSEETVVVPALSGKKVVDALKILTDIGLNTKIAAVEFNVTIPLNHVIYQEPAPGTEIKKGRDVRIVISKGRQSLPMPDLRGLTLEQGIVLLEESGFCRGVSSFIYNRELPKDKIIGHTPTRATLLQKGDCVDLLISRGKRPEGYKMPELRGFSLEKAILAIEAYHLTLGSIRQVFQKGMAKDTIVQQEPSAGYMVTEGTSVNLDLNGWPDKTTADAPGVRKGIDLLKIKSDNGFIKSRIRVRLKRRGMMNDIFDSYVKPGEEMWILIPRDDDTQVFVYKDENLVETRDINKR